MSQNNLHSIGIFKLILNLSAVSDKFPSYFTPAGYTFAIWGIIFAGLGKNPRLIKNSEIFDENCANVRSF